MCLDLANILCGSKKTKYSQIICWYMSTCELSHHHWRCRSKQVHGRWHVAHGLAAEVFKNRHGQQPCRRRQGKCSVLTEYCEEKLSYVDVSFCRCDGTTEDPSLRSSCTLMKSLQWYHRKHPASVARMLQRGPPVAVLYTVMIYLPIPILTRLSLFC